MKFAIVFAAVLVVYSAEVVQSLRVRRAYCPFASSPRPPASSVNRATSNDQGASIVRYNNDINPDGSYAFSFETDNGIVIKELGTPRDFGGNPPAVPVVSQGSYSFTSPEGILFTIKYNADENGFQPEGDAIPTPHPVPEAILKSLEYNARNSPPKK